MWQLRMALIKVPVLLPQWLSRGWMGAAVPGLKCTNLISQHGQTSLRPRAPNPAARERITSQKCKMLKFFPDGKKSLYIFFPDTCVPAVKTCTITVQNKVGELKGRLTNLKKKNSSYSNVAKRYTNKRDKQYIPHDGLPRFLSWGAESHKSRHSHKAPRVLTQLTAHCLHHQKSKKS